MLKRLISITIIAAFLLNVNSVSLLANVTDQHALRVQASSGTESEKQLKNSVESDPPDPDDEKALAVLDEMGLTADNPATASNRDFWLAMFKKATRVGDGGENPMIYPFGPFEPVSFLDEAREKAEYGVVDYETQIHGNDRYAELAGRSRILINILEGGQGLKLERHRYVKEIHGREKVGAKGTDLAFKIYIEDMAKQLSIDMGELTKRLARAKRVKMDDDNKPFIYISIAEISLLQIIHSIQQGHFSEFAIEPIVSVVSEPSKPSYERLLARESLRDIIEGIKNPRTYEETLQGPNIYLRWHEARPYPYLLQRRTKEPVVGDASASHGEWGFRFLREILHSPAPRMYATRIFYNGDNVNARPNKFIVGWMHKDRVPFAILTVKRTKNDAKGGIMGVVKSAGGISVPDIQELATAESNRQAQLFQKIGLDVPYDEGEITGRPGKQPFNTNILYINELLVRKILKELAKIIGEGALYEIITPNVIEKKVKWRKQAYIQLEGPIAKCLLNLNKFFLTIDENDNYSDEQKEKIKAILSNRKIERLLVPVDVPRTMFFAPNKFAVDFWIQAFTDYYKLDMRNWRIKEVKGNGEELPLINWGLDDSPIDEEYYRGLCNFRDTLGTNTSIQNLESLLIRGRFIARDTILEGNVAIINRGYKKVDLAKVKDIPKVDGRIYLKDAEVIIDFAGRVVVRPWRGEKEKLSAMRETAPRHKTVSFMGFDVPTDHLLDETTASAIMKKILLEKRIPGDFVDYMLNIRPWPKERKQTQPSYKRVGFDNVARMERRADEISLIYQFVKKYIDEAIIIYDPYMYDENPDRSISEVLYMARKGLYNPNAMAFVNDLEDIDRLWAYPWYNIDFANLLGLDSSKEPGSLISKMHMQASVFINKKMGVSYSIKSLIEKCRRANPGIKIFRVVRNEYGELELQEAAPIEDNWPILETLRAIMSGA